MREEVQLLFSLRDMAERDITDPPSVSAQCVDLGTVTEITKEFSAVGR